MKRPEIDKLIAEAMFGWTWSEETKFWLTGGDPRRTFSPTSSVEDAMFLADHLGLFDTYGSETKGLFLHREYGKWCATYRWGGTLARADTIQELVTDLVMLRLRQPLPDNLKVQNAS